MMGRSYEAERMGRSPQHDEAERARRSPQSTRGDLTVDHQLHSRPRRHYDAIVVGARCAGAPTAMLLARRGYRVLVVDRATFPSDTLSTHLVHAPGVAALRRWGLLDRVLESGCPPIGTYAFDFGPFTLAGRPRPVEGSSTA